jgi:putative lipoic acid-binding regulatory protein
MTSDDFRGRLEFPCSYPIKAMGHESEDFETLVVSIIHQHVPSADISMVGSRSSRAGKYLSVTVTFMAQSQAQLDAVYQDLRRNQRVLMLL